LPAHDRDDDAWSDPATVSGAGIEPASHRARAARGRHSWTRNSGEWRQRERSADWTGPKHASGEWPTLHLDAARDSADLREPELFSSDWPPARPTSDWPPARPAEPRWTAQDWAAADSSPRREAASRRIDWLDGPDLDDVTPAPTAGLPGLASASAWASFAAGLEPAAGSDAAADGWSVSLWDEASKVWDDATKADATKDDATKADATKADATMDDATKVWDHQAWDHKAGDEKADWAEARESSWAEARESAVGDHRIRAETTDDGWTDEEWLRLGDAPTEELFTRTSTPRSHRRPEPMRKVTLRVLAAVLVAGGSVGLTMNLVSSNGNDQPAQSQVEDQNPQRFDGSVAPTQSASPTPTDPQTTSQADAATEPLAPATTRKATPAKATTTQPAPAAPAPAPTTPAPTTPPPTTEPVPTTPPPTTEPAPTTPPTTPSDPPASSVPASSQPTP
jgi:hypothetical protein